MLKLFLAMLAAATFAACAADRPPDPQSAQVGATIQIDMLHANHAEPVPPVIGDVQPVLVDQAAAERAAMMSFDFCPLATERHGTVDVYLTKRVEPERQRGPTSGPADRYGSTSRLWETVTNTLSVDRSTTVLNC